MRLARLRPRHHPERALLLASAGWQECVAALQRCVAPTQLEFDGGAST
jgi:hypothetical protein